MAELKVVINDPKTGKSYQKVLSDNPFLNQKIGAAINGSLLDLHGYEFQLTGGSDSSGFPMRKDVSGLARRRLLLSTGPGLRTIGTPKGFRKRKTVASNTVVAQIAQINLKVTTYGQQALPEALGIKEEKKEEPAKA